MIDKSKQFETIIYSGDLISIKLFQVNEDYFYFEKDRKWIIDAGVELTFPKGIVCLGWNTNLEGFSFENKNFSLFYNESNYSELNHKEIEKLIGNEVIEYEFKPLEFEYIADYTMKVQKEIRTVELILRFKNNSVLQLSTMDYDLTEHSGPINYRYHISSSILVTLDNLIVIKT